MNLTFHNGIKKFTLTLEENYVINPLKRNKAYQKEIVVDRTLPISSRKPNKTKVYKIKIDKSALKGFDFDTIYKVKTSYKACQGVSFDNKQWRCKSGNDSEQYIPTVKLCDGKKDCDNGADEEEFRCKGSLQSIASYFAYYLAAYFFGGTISITFLLFARNLGKKFFLHGHLGYDCNQIG